MAPTHPPDSPRLHMTDREKNSETDIQDYLDDRLSPVDRQQIEDQLAGDPLAQKELEADAFSILGEIKVFGFRGEYGRKAET